MRTAVCPTCGAKRLKWAQNALGMRYLVDFETGVEHYKTCPGVKHQPVPDGQLEGEPDEQTPESEPEGKTELEGAGDSPESDESEQGEGDQSESESSDSDSDNKSEPEPDQDESDARQEERDDSGESDSEIDQAERESEPESDEGKSEDEPKSESEQESKPEPGEGDGEPEDQPKAPEPESEPESKPEPVDTNHRLQARLNRYVAIGLNVLTVGPAGGGKTTAARLAAEANDLEYFEQSVGPQTSQWDLIGFVGPNGEYHPGSLYRPFKQGGLAMLDEVDAGNPGILVVLNSLMANGHYRFPNGEEVQRHTDFRLIAGANTYGRGADRLYVGRNQLDAATLDRFAVLEWDYDERIEQTWAGGEDAKFWVAYVQAVRKVAFDLRMRFVVSPRASIFGARMLREGIARDEVCEAILWKGLSKDERAKFAHVKYPEPLKPEVVTVRETPAPDITWRYRELEERAERENREMGV